MLKKLISRLILFVVGLFIIGLGIAGLGNAAEFSADMIQKSQMGNSEGKVFVKGEKFRQEMNMGGEKQIMIFQRDKGVVLVLMPDLRMYMEMSAGGQQNMAPATPEEMGKMGDKKYLGEEEVNGYKCKKYRFTPSDPSVGTTTMWISKKLNFPIKTEMEGSSGPTSMEYKNIQEKKVPDSLFKIPAGYQKMSMPNMPGMPGMPLRLNHSIFLPENLPHIRITDPVRKSMPPIPKHRVGASHIDLNDLILAFCGFSGSYKISTRSPFLYAEG